jgi:hypothetical protein
MIMSTTTRYDDAVELYSDAPHIPRLERLLSADAEHCGQ